MIGEKRSSSPLILLLFLGIPLAIVIWLTLRVDLTEPLTFDELIVSRVALQPYLIDLWKILASGQSPHPPLNFLVVRCIYAAFGVNELTTRLPSTVGFAVMCVSLFFFVAKRSHAAYGTLAMLFPAITLARAYAVEAKPYGVLLGWSGVILICWRYAGAGRWRGWALAGLGLALCCATCSHFFGALLALPVLAGEAVRSVERRRVDRLMLAVTTLNWWPLLAFIPILRAGNQVHGVHPWQTMPWWGFVLKSADQLLIGAAAPILICMTIAAASRVIWPSMEPNRGLPFDEIAAAAALALLPLIAIFGLKLAGLKIIEEKYLIPMVLGLAILLAWSAYSIGGRASAGIVMAAILGLWGGRDFVRDLRAARDSRISDVQFATSKELRAFGKLPIVVETPKFMTLEVYARPDIADRVHFLIDPVGAERYFRNDALHRSMLLNPRFFGPHVQPVDDFHATHPEFLIYEEIPGPADWILEEYRDVGARIEVVMAREDQRWYLVRQPPTSVPTSRCVRH